MTAWGQTPGKAPNGSPVQPRHGAIAEKARRVR
jgi:hypothetical protein